MRINKRACKYCYTAANLRLVSLSDEDRKQMLKKHSTAKWALAPNIYFVEYSSFSKSYSGYGSKNVNGGIEFINPHYMETPVTLENFCYVFVSNKQGEISKSCCLFFDFADYLAYLSIQEKKVWSLPEHCDCFILSHVRNFIPMVVSTDDYRNIYMFFPNNVTGNMIAKTIQQRNLKHVHDCSFLYASEETLHEYYNHLLS